jgi:hypothetical protein
MKFIVSILLIALLSFAFGLYLPWWSIALVAFIVTALIHQRPLRAFISGFIALFLLWAIVAMIVDISNQHILSQKIASVLPLGGSYILLILVTGFIGGLVAAFGALSGSYLRTVAK